MGKACATGCARCCLVKLEDEDTGQILKDRHHLQTARRRRLLA